MLKHSFLTIALFICISLQAQIEISKIVGKNGSDVGLGYGAYLKFSYPVSDAADVTFEAGANIFPLKDDNTHGWADIPLKAGYRYTFDQSGTGFYIEPQAGYNIYGVDADDNKFTGLILAAGTGYLFKPSRWIQFDLGLLYESAFHTGGAANYISLRLTHNFSLHRRNNDD